MHAKYIGLQHGITDACALVNCTSEWGVDTVAYAPEFHYMGKNDKQLLENDIKALPDDLRIKLGKRYFLRGY